jgi:glycosyltransferase involved in cell wall biosynthesis
MDSSIIISICISSRKRPEGIKRLLKSISEVLLPIKKYQIQIIVVENEEQNNLEKIVEDFKSYSNIPILYYLEKKQGICYARNRAVKEANGSDFCIFVDDDQIVDKNWLCELLSCQEFFQSDGVYGSNPPLFEFPIKPCVMKFHTPNYSNYGTKLKSAPTNCLLMKKKILDKFIEPFDLRLNQLGGEDTLFTSQIVKQGATIISNPRAIAYEVIPEERATSSYILKRSYRNGNTYANVHLIKYNDINSKINLLIYFITRLLWGFVVGIPKLLFDKNNRFEGLIRIASNLGGLDAIFGGKTVFYR